MEGIMGFYIVTKTTTVQAISPSLPQIANFSAQFHFNSRCQLSIIQMDIYFLLMTHFTEQTKLKGMNIYIIFKEVTQKQL